MLDTQKINNGQLYTSCNLLGMHIL